MTILFVLIPLGLILTGIAVGAFIWAASAGQFDDLDTPGRTVMEDDEEPPRT